MLTQAGEPSSVAFYQSLFLSIACASFLLEMKRETACRARGEVLRFASVHHGPSFLFLPLESVLRLRLDVAGDGRITAIFRLAKSGGLLLCL
jgi:hypothetical protein